MIKKTIWILVAVTALAFVLGATVRADERNKKSVLTFIQPVEISGHVSTSQAAQLPKTSMAIVPSIAIDAVTILTDLETVAIVAVTPDEQDAITAVIRTRALPNVAARVSAVGTAGVMQPVQKASHATQLPQTAGVLSLIVLLSVVSIGVAFALMVFGGPRRVSTV